MRKESFKPIPVVSPNKSTLQWRLRLLVDLQLRTIADFLREELPKLVQGDVLDIGAGEQPWKSWVAQGARYVALDVSHSREFGMKNDNPDVILYDGQMMPFGRETFDGALLIEVLEHARDPNLLLAEAHRVLKPGAVFLGTVPWSARNHHLPFDYYRFTEVTLEFLLRDNGFTDISIKPRGNDYCVVANKVILITIRNFRSINFANFPVRILLSMVFGVFALLSGFLANVSLLFTGYPSDDPLGYSWKAIRT